MKRFFAFGLVVLVAIGRSAADEVALPESLKALAAADKVILYSIDGNGYAPGKEPNAAEKFNGFPVLGKMELGKEARTEVLGALVKGINNDSPAKCFEPRHAIRAIKGDAVTDYVICFACNQTSVMANGKLTKIRIAASAQPALDKLLKGANVPLAPK
jgi:hypothetical protein